MTNEERDEILRTAYETIDRVEQNLRETRSFQTDKPRGHFEPIRRRQMRRDPEPETQPEPEEPPVRYTESTWTTRAVDDGGWWAAIDARINAAVAAERDTICAIVAEALGGALKDTEKAQSRILHAELNALRVEVHRLENLLEALRVASEHERAKVIDLPAMPLQRNDVN